MAVQIIPQLIKSNEDCEQSLFLSKMRRELADRARTLTTVHLCCVLLYVLPMDFLTKERLFAVSK